MAGLIISPRARIFQGHDWVYGTEVRKVFGNPQPGDVVALKDFKDRFLGSAMFNPHSQIVARRFSRRKQELDGDFFSRRISQAVELRRQWLPEETLTRLVWSESDGLPGLIVDRYADYLVVQTLTIAMEHRLPIILNVLEDLLSPRGIIVRNDSPMLAAEGIEPSVRVARGQEPEPFAARSGNVQFMIDLQTGQKTGLYLDQLDNYAAVARFARGRRVLDCFCNQGPCRSRGGNGRGRIPGRHGRRGAQRPAERGFRTVRYGQRVRLPEKGGGPRPGRRGAQVGPDHSGPALLHQKQEVRA